MKIKGQKKLSISIVVIILLLIIIAAEIIVNTETKADYSGTTSDNLFEYTVATDKKYVLITKYIGSQQRVIIPSTIDNYPVKAITTTALKNCTTAEYIYIPSTIVEIGSSGIGDKYKIEADAFSGCNNLNTVEIDSNNQYYANNNGDGIIYNKAKTKIYYCPNAKEISSLTIADGVTTICTSAFARCKTLNEVVMPESLISINNNAFRNCENLLKVTLKNGIKNIGHSAFGWCKKLTQINIPNTVETIDDYAFEECHELTNINIPSSVTSISTSTFHNCHKLISINVSSENNSYTNYNDDGILYDKNMKTIVRYPQAKAGTKYTIPDNITEIADNAFWRCSNLTQVTIPNTVTTIGESAFHYCENLTQITIPYNVTKLQRSTFGGCTNLSKVNLPDSIIAIDSMTFSDCTSLTEIEIPGSTTSMENTIFSNCTNLKRVIIPDSVTSMGYNIFHNDTNIKIVTKSNSTAHQYATSNSIAVELDNTSPTIQSITYSTKETTNGSVKVTITANEPLQRIVSDNRTWEYVPNTDKKSITAQISSNTTNEALTIKDLVGNTATATINVNNIDTTPPVGTVTMDKDSYKSGETATITAVFNEPVQDGTPQIVIARNNFRYEIKKMTKQNNYTYVYYHDTAKLEGDQRVEISEACDLAGNVMETVSKNFYVRPTLKRIDVTTQPNKNTYTVGENFDTTGMKITAVYGDNTSKEVTDYTVVDGTNLQLGKTCVIISYTDGGITKTVLVFISVVENIDNLFEYKVISDGGYISITKYIGNKQSVTIPSMINNYPVKTIAQLAFKDCTTVKYIYIPSSIEGIGTDEIGDTAKYESSVFVGCSNLNTVEIDSNNQYYTNNNGDGIIYDKNKTKLYYYPTAKTDSSFTIIDGVTSIEYRAFANCTNINTIVAPKGLVTIGVEAFLNCTNLSKITLNEGVKTIEANAFGLCESLEELKLPSTVETIGLTAFQGCVELTKIDIPSNTTSIESSAFSRCLKLASINVDSANNSYTNYNNDGVLYTKDMTTIVRYPQAKVGTEYTISNNTTKIDYQAFEQCNNLTTVEIPDTVTFIDAFAFARSKNLQQITIPEGITELSYFIFSECSSLKEVNLPDTLKEISRSTFDGCTSLEEIVIPGNVTKIDDFTGCTNLNKIIIPDSVTDITSGSFAGADNLTIVTKSNSTAHQFATNKNINVELDDISPTIESIVYSPDEITSGSVKVTITANEPIQDIVSDGRDWEYVPNTNRKSIMAKMQNNIANEELTIKDLVGNKTTVTVNTKDTDTDTTPPTVTITTDKEKYNSGETVVITATFNEPIEDGTPTISILQNNVTKVSEKMSKQNEYTYTYSYNTTTASGEQKIIISEACDLAGNVMESKEKSIYITTILTKIEVTTQPSKTTYIEGQNFDKTGMKVTATYNNGTTKEVTNYTITDGNNLTVEKTSVTVGYTEDGITKTTTVPITVNKKSLSKIDVTTQPSKTTYIEGQNFDKTGMKVTATYSNGTSKEVTNYTITDGDNLTVGKTTVAVSYTEEEVTKTTTVSITVNKKSLSKIDVTTQPSKTTYIEGQNFDKAGMKVTATYSDGTSKEVTNYTITDGNNLTVGKTSVTVSYTEEGVTKTTTVPITVNKKSLSKIDVTTQPSKITYIEGQNFDKTDMKVTATYNNGTTKEVTNYTITDGNNLTVGKTSVTVSYTEDGITKTTTVQITVTAKQTDKLTVEFNQYNEVDNNDRKYLCNISPETTLEKMKENITTNGTIKVYSNNKEITGSKDLVTTSMKLEISLDDEKLELTIVVKGDTNGDGKSDLYDILEINKHRLNKALLTNERLLAGDVDNNNKVDIDDILRINKFRLGKINVL